MSTISTGLLLRVTSGPSTGAMVALGGPLVVGREGDLRVDDPTVSRCHVVVEPADATVTVRDAGSANGFAVNGTPAAGPVQLQPGDELTLGRSRVRLLRLVRHHDGPDGPHLLVDDQRGRVRALPLGETTVIGRDATADLVIEHPQVSRRHATIRRGPDGLVIEDHSSNGTTVAGAAVAGTARLGDHDVIRLGTAPLSLTVQLRAGGGPVTIGVRQEGARRIEMTTLDAAPTATVAEVTLALCTERGIPGPVLLYRETDGALLHPDDTWSATGPRHGDVVVLGTGDASAETPAPGRRWPRATPPRLNQLPRTVHPPAAVPLEPPAPPESLSWKGRGVMWQLIGGSGVVLMAVTISLIRPQYALFGLMTGTVGVLAILASLLGEQSRRRHRVRQHRDELAALDARLAASAREHAARFHDLSPSIDELEDWLTTRSERLWERRPSDPDALRLRLGVGHRHFALAVDDHHRGIDPAARAVLDRHRAVGPAPVLGPGPSAGSFGVVGDRAGATGLARRAILEAAALHPPHQLAIWVLAVDDQWRWAAWVPHTANGDRISTNTTDATRVLDALGEELARAERRSSESPDLLHLVVVPLAWDRALLQGLVGRLAGLGLALVVADDHRSLPSGLTAVVEVGDDGLGQISGHFDDPPFGPFAIDRLDPADAERFALSLAQVSAGSEATRVEGITELLGLGPVGSIDVAASWAADREPLTVAIGSDPAGEPVTVGFRRDGPHGMVAGTTGSGKSELLQTLLGALALTHPPDRLTLFLIDYKGGATFASLANLPHVVGLVTDLENDTSLATRAFTALDAEIVRRKRLLDHVGVPNIIEYEQLDDPTLPPMPNLLVVIDEFALMVKSQPELKDRLDTVATQGRSLGVHMLLATQSPTGVITHAVRTNTNLWISLRVVADSESVELLGARDAARIPDGSPGRGFIRLGAGDHLRGFQAARIARPVVDDEQRVRIARASVTSAAPPTTGRTELDVVVERIAGAWAATGQEAPPPLWLPPLPGELAPAAVPDVEVPPDRLVAVVGLADFPGEQRQDPHVVDLTASGHLGVAGVLGAGKTTALLQVASDLARHHSPADLHLYAVDAGAGSLGALAALPHTAAVVGAHDAERVTRLIDRLDRIVDRRREVLAASGLGDFVRWRADGGDDPWVVLVLDDLPAFRESAERIEGGRLVDRFTALLQNGPAVGVHVVVSFTQQVDLRMREASLIPARILLRLTDPADYSMIEVRMRPGEVPPFPPGRGLVKGGTWIQIAEPTPDDVEAVAARWEGVATDRRPAAIERLPRELTRDELPVGGPPLALGVGGAELGPVGIDLDRGAPVLLVAGPIQSGRSTTLRSAIDGILEREPERAVTIVALRPGPLRDLEDRPNHRVVTDAAAVPDALDAALEGGPGLVVVDDAEGLAGQLGVAERLERIVRGAGERDTRVVIAARSSDLASLFEPWARYVVSLRRAVLLQPTQDDAFPFGVRLPTIPAPVGPGRGLLIDGAAASVVQVAMA